MTLYNVPSCCEQLTNEAEYLMKNYGDHVQFIFGTVRLGLSSSANQNRGIF